MDWPQWFGPNRDGVWREDGLVAKFPAGGPPINWRTPIGSGYSGPAVAGGRVYVMDRERAKDAEGKPLRATRAGIPGNERILCLNAADGKLVWKYEYDCPYKVSYPSGPRTTPVVHQGRVYTLGAMGDLLCLDAATGTVRWSKNFVKEYQCDLPVWGWSANLLLDGDLLYSLVGGKDSAVVAFHKDTGKEVWKALTSEEVCYSPPMIYEAGGKRQLVIWLSDSINGLDAATGQVYWTHPYPASGQPVRPAVNIATVRRMDDRLLVCSSYHGPMMLKLAADKPDATVLWRLESKDPMKPEHLSSLMSTPVLKDGHIYGISFMGDLCCLEAATGKQLWQTYDVLGGKKEDCGTAFLVPQGNRFILFTDQGDLILADLTPKGYKEIDRAHILNPVQAARGRQVVWSHPAFAQRCVFARNDQEIICVSLAEKVKS
jgi:outer membrane protein assembly factor BamB